MKKNGKNSEDVPNQQSLDSFSLEMRTAKLLKKIGFTVRQSGLYFDPLTMKQREYDIRAGALTSDGSIYLAVECKSFQKNIYCYTVRREEHEAYHTIYSMETKILAIQKEQNRYFIRVHQDRRAHFLW